MTFPANICNMNLSIAPYVSVNITVVCNSAQSCDIHGRSSLETELLV